MRSCNRQDTPRTTVLRWVRRFAVDGLLDRARSGRPLSVMTPTVVGRIGQLAKAKRGRRSRSTRQIAACAELSQDFHQPVRRFTLKVSSPMSNLRCLCSGMVTSSDNCASRLSRRNVIGDAVCLLMRRHLCVILATIVATTSSGHHRTHRACCPLSLHQRLRCFLCIGRIASLLFFPRILLHRSTSRS